MAGPLIPKEALAYIKNKTPVPGFSYQDIWNEEHATMFTVAKATQIDVLSDIKKAVETAIENGETLEHFRKNLRPILMEKGWWGKKEMIDPLTGKTVNARLGSDRRLKTIYDTNLRSAYQAGRWERSQASASHPYLMYRVGNSQHHREEHLAWEGLILPKDDPWWNRHYPDPLRDLGCQCWAQGITEERKRRLEKNGVAVPPSADGTPGYTIPVKTSVPAERYRTYINEKTGIIERLPVGAGPGFNWDAGQGGRLGAVLSQAARKARRKIPERSDRVLESLVSSRAYKNHYDDFIERALKDRDAGRAGGRNAIPAGFPDQGTLAFLGKRGMSLGENSLIFLGEGAVRGAEPGGRGASPGNPPEESGWRHLTDYLLAADIFFDPPGGLIYLVKRSERAYIKIAVDLGSGRGSPKVGSLEELNLDSETGRDLDEYARISRLKKIR
ncbi:MAG: phage head morphogenesis protein [Spirochaetaceae bacterium]|jgi:hypothetical protein|nr:phage head morphogenesis protein [Spirochaetaceae bacterium]